MEHPYLLPPEHRAIPLTSLRYSSCRGATPLLRMADPAASLMVDLQRDLVVTVTEDIELETALDAMFRLGVRSMLVVRQDAVVGVLSLRDAQRPRTSLPGPTGNGANGTAIGTAAAVHVGAVMVPWSELPAIDWPMLQQARIADLADMFTGSGAQYLVVLDDETSRSGRVRGLIARERLDRSAQTPLL